MCILHVFCILFSYVGDFYGFRKVDFIGNICVEISLPNMEETITNLAQTGSVEFN